MLHHKHQHKRILAALPALLLAALPLGACTGLEDEEHDEETEPTAADIDYVRAGTIDCTREAGTGYRSGSSFAIELVHVDGKPVELETADAFWLMREEAAAAGVDITVVSGFRTMAEQRRLYNCYVNCSCNNCNLAARPGYSNHQSGSALDLNTSASGVLTWLNRNGARFGFRRTVSSEPWHWELTGTAPALGPCTGGGTPSSDLTISSPAEGATLANNVVFAIEPDTRVHHLRWLSDGITFGSSERASDGFAVRHHFRESGEHTVEAVAYDADDREISRAHVRFVIEASESPIEPAPPTLTLDSPADLGWYANGLDFKSTVLEGEGVSRVAYFNSDHLLGESTDPETSFAVHAALPKLGFRAITARAYDDTGRELAETSVTIRVLPGEEENLGPAVRFHPRNGDTIDNGAPIIVAGSETIERVVISEGGREIGTARREAEGFSVNHTFATTGAHGLVAIGYNAAGQNVARHEIWLTVR